MRKQLGLLLVFCFLLTGCREKKVAEKPPKLVKVTEVTEREVQLYNTYVGHVKASVQVEVKAQVEGVLTSYNFVEGQEVKAGELILTIDSRPYEAQLAKAKAALAQSVVNLRYAQDVVSRNEPLAKDNYVSKLQYEQYLTSVMDYRAQIEQNKAEIETAEINISYCNIHAPMDAITGVLQVQVGNLIQNAQETPLVVLNKITPTYTYFSVPQKDLPRIMKLHRSEPLEIEAYLNDDFTTPFGGKLDLINNQLSDETGSIWLRGLFPNEKKLLWPGEFVTVRLLLEKKTDALLIPEEAVNFGQNGKYVYVLRSDSTVELKNVETGQRLDGNMRLIEKGLQSGDKVVVQGQINLKNGDKVEVKKS